ncbi:MAG TPA: antitoxin VapB family protein [Gemmatimonadota bacterium]|nr:antitoxin VapB family protein [Gemmatimonadota bacterium]
MSIKTISLRLEAYERLRRARRTPSESFSDVVLRARWPDAGMTASELLALCEAEGPFLSESTVDRIEAANAEDAPPKDKWRGA